MDVKILQVINVLRMKGIGKALKMYTFMYCMEEIVIINFYDLIIIGCGYIFLLIVHKMSGKFYAKYENLNAIYVSYF